tara:strand:+ start:9402 stop:10208 length:807 start_codon:yes stop_codon:yes gene_type:complete
MILISWILAWAFAWQDMEDLEDKKLAGLYGAAPLKIPYLRAMEHYLKGEDVEAENQFILITLKAYDQNWSFADRKLIVYSYLRICMIRPGRCENSYKEIAAFDQDMIAHVEDDVFSPPMIAKLMLAKNKEKQKTYYWQPNENWMDAKFILVNGKIYRPNPRLQIPLNLHKNRIVKVMPDYRSESLVASVKKLQNYQSKLLVKPPIAKALDLQKDFLPEKDMENQNTWKLQERDLWTYGIITTAVALFIYHETKKESSSSPPAIYTSQN